MNHGDDGVQKTWNQFFARLEVPTSGGGEVRGQIFRWPCNNWPATIHFFKIPQTRMLNYQKINLFSSTFCSPSKTQKLMQIGWQCFLVFRWNWMVKVLPQALWTTRAGFSHHVHLHHHLVQRCLCQECRPRRVARLCICLTLPMIRWLVNLHLDSGGPYNLTVYHRWLVNLEI